MEIHTRRVDMYAGCVEILYPIFGHGMEYVVYLLSACEVLSHVPMLKLACFI